MAEKNTHSILESIKKKLNKFDQKPENQMTDFANEFEYVAPLKKEDLSKEQIVLQGSEIPASPAPVSDASVKSGFSEQSPKPEKKQEKPVLDDIDWDDESSIKPLVEEVASGKQNSDDYEKFEEDDLENSEDEVNFGEESDDEIEEEGKEENNLEIPPLDLPQQEDELSFVELEKELKEKEIAEVKKEEAQKDKTLKDDDFNLDDLDFEESTKEEMPETAAISEALDNYSAADSDPIDNEIDELEREIQRKKEEAEEAKKGKEAHFELEDELLGIRQNIGSNSASNLTDKVSSITVPSPVFSELPTNKEPEPEAEEPRMQELKSSPAPLVQENHSMPKGEAADDFAQFPELPPVQMQDIMETQPKQNLVIEKKGIVIDENTVKQTTDSVKKLLDAKNIVSGIASFSQSPILAELAMQMLEPKLEKWLNANLATMVEQVVREEIKKIIPRD